MNLQKYTQKSIEALRAAQSDATERGNSRLEPEHVFLALMRQEGGLIPELIKRSAFRRTRQYGSLRTQ